MEEAGRAAAWLLGLDAEDLSALQMTVRAVVVYLAALIMVRWGEKRFMGKGTAFECACGVVGLASATATRAVSDQSAS
ncbi:hypothetical protein [Falsiroseomonas sp.]|uniref:hypothetical protein n=1 Tax=Falsiroseomonas sp. TaxID=2870721 RepID=UPI0035677DB8